MGINLQRSDLSFLSSQPSLTEVEGGETKPNTITTKGVSDSGSDTSSPSVSNFFSTETDDDDNDDDDEEEGYVAELTRQMANYMLQEDEKHEKPWGCSGSPQSTLWSPFGSSMDSPVGPSREPSPPVTPMIEKFEKMKIIEEIIVNPVIPKSQQFQSKQALIDDQIRAAQANFLRLKQEKESEKRKQHDAVYRNKARAAVGGWYNGAQKLGGLQQQQKQGGANHNYNNCQQQPGSGMRAVFLNGSGSRPGSSGTGVFLPRRTGSPLESCKQTGCSTVLIPARVVQALKLHFDKVGIPSRFNADLPPHHDALLVGSYNSTHSQQKGRFRPVPASNHQDISLPKEWTY